MFGLSTQQVKNSVFRMELQFDIGHEKLMRAVGDDIKNI